MSFDAFARQISNRNFLAPTGFKFTLARTPKVDFLAQSANIPEITMGFAVQSTYLKDLPIPGDKLNYGDFTLRFIVDEDLVNYRTIQDWLRGLAYPETIEEYSEWIEGDQLKKDPNTSDGTLLIYNSSFRVCTKVKFRGLFPTSLTTVAFDAAATDVEYVTADVTFKYDIYDIEQYEP
jgi:hypothetical protein|tara:strand:+ start:196 stop:729 length:534 start_codon:yes stop_codon:yes gene_type:complete